MDTLAKRSEPFLDWMESWLKNLPVLPLPQPAQTAVLSVDVVNGFCVNGPLASPRVAQIVAPITRLLQAAWAGGVRHILLLQDTHEPDAVEFSAWPAHCVRGTAEAEPVDEFKALPFFSAATILQKNSIASGLNADLAMWIAAHPEVDTFVVVGDCTDLCTYQMAMYLRTDANERQLARRVIVPVDCVETYDRALEAAQTQGGFAHPADLLHATFLYHMALNGIEVVQKVVP